MTSQVKLSSTTSVEAKCSCETGMFPKTKRKQREVKNAIVDIDYVAVQPGHNYCDWIEITKKKLKVCIFKKAQLTKKKTHILCDS